MIVIMIVIIFHPFDLTMKSLLSVQPVVDGQKFGVFRLGGDPTNDILRNSGRQAFPTKEIYQIHVLLRTFQHQRSLAGIYTTIYKDKKSFLAESSFSISSNEFIIFSPCPASRRCSWKRARKWRRKEPIAAEGLGGVGQRRNNRLSLRSWVSRGRSSRSLWSRIGFASLVRTTRNRSCL